MCKLYPDRIYARMKERPQPMDLSTGPYPEFPTDLQSVMLAVASVAQGRSRIRETVFEERFATAGELKKMGADISVEEGTAYVTGGYPLAGGEVCAADLRGGAALVTAGLASEGDFHISRGYEDICRDLSAVGAAISLKED